MLSPLVVEVDTRVPYASFRWISIGQARIWYEGDWWINIQVLFFRKTMRLADMMNKPKQKKADKEKKKPAKRTNKWLLLRKLVRVIKTFRVTTCQIAIDTGDYTRDAQLYALNFLPYTFRHLEINFRDENYLVLKIRNRPWKMLSAYWR
jgi:hypothetical protein